MHGMAGFTAAYLNDLVIFAQPWEKHVVHVRNVLGRLRETGLSAEPEKCQMGDEKVCLLR